MLLAINCNNTNIKFGVVDGDRIIGEWRQHTSAMRTADEHAVWLFQLMAMEGIDPKSITADIVAITPTSSSAWSTAIASSAKGPSIPGRCAIAVDHAELDV